MWIVNAVNDNFAFVRQGLVGKGAGALRASNIDTSTSDADIQNFLSETIHSAVGASACEDILPDQCLPHQCSSKDLSDTSGKFVRSLHDELSQRKLKAGCLLCVANPETHDSFACVLGVVQKKPIVHTLLLVTFETSGDIVFMVRNGAPHVVSSHQFFAQLLENYTGDSSSLSFHFQVWSYNMKFLDGHLLIACADNIQDEFQVSSAPVKRKQAEKVKLPFNIKSETRRGKRNPAKKTQRGKGVKKQTKVPVNNDGGHDSNTEGSNSGFDSPARAGSANQDDVNLNAECDDIEPISETHANEQKEASILEQDMQKSDEKRHEVAATVAATGSVAQSSFFSKSLGMEEVALAASGRSICLHCKERIPKNTIRYSWHHNKLKPPSWVHSFCVWDLAQQTGLQDRAVQKLREFTNAASGSDGGELQQDASRLLQLFTG